MTCHAIGTRPSRLGRERRAFCVGLATVCSGVWAQPSMERSKVRVGVLWTGAAPAGAPTRLERMLRQLSGPAKQVDVDMRFGTGATLRRHAEELVAAKVDLIVANGTPAALLAQRATKSIPIVYLIAGDPVDLGLAQTLAQPGANLTGVYTMTSEVSGKRIALLRDAVPQATRIGLLWMPARGNENELNNARVAALSAGLGAVPLAATSKDELLRRFGELRAQRIDALSVLTAPVVVENLRLVAELAAQHRVPAIAGYANFTDLGGLMSYASHPLEVLRIAVAQAQKVLKGDSPADMPVQRTSNLILSVNLKAAAALGLTLPPALAMQAQRTLR
jgi:putative ABC transport system substrate-binding protein